MANPGFLVADTILYSPMEPDGRQFYQGESWPGDAWSKKKGGEPVGENAAIGALKDLIEANDRLDRQSVQLAAKDHDLAVMAAARDEATAKLDDAEQRAVVAEGARADAEAAAKSYMTERDQARAALATANQGIADLTAQVETLTAPKKAAKADAPASDASASA